MYKLMISLAIVSICGLAQGADNGFYLGAGVTQAKLDNIGSNFDTSDLDDFKLDNTAWKVIAGFRPIKLFGIEANYDELGDEHRTTGNIVFDGDAKAFAVYGVGYLPIPVVDVYGKLGLARWESNASARDVNGSDLFRLDDNGTDLAYGVGAAVNIGQMAARLEYEQFDVDNTDGVELLSLGLTFTFL